MAIQKARFPFKEKEGKFFAPLVGRATKKTVVNGVVQSTLVPKSGVKGVYAITRLVLPVDQSTTKKELYAISTESFNSSN